MDARSEVLARVRAALTDAPAVPEVPRAHRSVGDGPPAGSDALVALLTERLRDYGANVRVSGPGGVGAAVVAALADHAVTSVVVPDGLPDGWCPDVTGVVRHGDDPRLRATELDGIDAAVSACRLAIAETGTIVLDGGAGQGRRALSLVPDLLVVVVRIPGIVAGVPDALAALDAARPMTWISGPSATSDIELTRVEGVHGPRRLEVVLVRSD